MMNIGKHHSALVLSMAPELLSTHPFFESIEPDINDPACILFLDAGELRYSDKIDSKVLIDDI